jgi:hypothetical protein
MTGEDLRLKAVPLLLDHLDGEMKYSLINDLSKKNINLSVNLKNYTIEEIEGDRLIILTLSISEKIKEMSGEDINKEDIDAWIIEKCGNFPLEIATTNEELVIYLKETE